MVIQNAKFANATLFGFDLNRRPRRIVLPWRTPSQANGSFQASTSSEVDEAKTEAAFPPDLFESAPHPLSPAELHSLYAGTTVPQHRYLAPALVAAVSSPAIALDPDKWFAGLEGIHFASVVDAWLNSNSDPSFEQLKCIGFDPHTSQLTAVLKIKQRRGYAGGTATAGSREFVAFWVDWGLGFQYEGTVSVAVFDFGSLPASGLEICVGLPVDLSRHTPAKGSVAPTIKVRAVLSWNTPPSTTHPYAQVVWGNSLDLRIAISSHRATYSRQETGLLTIPQRNNSAFNADDLAERVPSCVRHRPEPVDWARDAASC